MKLTGVYIGKVVDNDDPKKGGRVRVFCSNPEVSNYYASLLQSTNVVYRFPGNDDMSGDFIRQIKPYLSWARVINPIIGGSAPGKFDAENNTASRTNDIQHFNTASSTQYNADGYRMTAMDAIVKAGVIDSFAFPEAGMNGSGFAGGATDYIANTYSSAPTGLYNVPRVGSTVGVIFLNGDINKPIVVGAVADVESMNLNLTDGGVDTGIPGNFENI